MSNFEEVKLSNILLLTLIKTFQNFIAYTYFNYLNIMLWKISEKKHVCMRLCVKF